jgi:hypothetical protein
VYYMDERWYARDRGHWVYYRKEPDVLCRQRMHVQEAHRESDHEHHRLESSKHEVALQQPQSVMQPGTPLH